MLTVAENTAMVATKKYKAIIFYMKKKKTPTSFFTINLNNTYLVQLFIEVFLNIFIDIVVTFLVI